MKIFNFLTIFLTTTTIFWLLPVLVIGQTTTEPLPEEPLLLEEPLQPALLTIPTELDFLNCQWFNAVDFQGHGPTTKQDEWNFKNATCSSAMVEKINATNSTSSFFLVKSWDYGELLLAFLIILFLFFSIFLLIFNFFFEPVFKIRGKQ